MSQLAALQLHVLHICGTFGSRVVHCQPGIQQLSVLCPILQSAHTMADLFAPCPWWSVCLQIFTWGGCTVQLSTPEATLETAIDVV